MVARIALGQLPFRDRVAFGRDQQGRQVVHHVETVDQVGTHRAPGVGESQLDAVDVGEVAQHGVPQGRAAAEAGRVERAGAVGESRRRRQSTKPVALATRGSVTSQRPPSR